MSIQVISPETDVAKTTEVSPDQTVVSNPSVSKKVSAQVASTQAPVKATAAAALAKKEEEEAARQAQIAEAADQAAETGAQEQVAESGETVEAARTIATVAEEIDASSETLAGVVADAPMMFAQAGAAAAGGAAGGISTAAIVAGVAVVGVAAAASSSSSSTPAATTTTPTPTPTPAPAPVTTTALTALTDSLVGTTGANAYTAAAGTLASTDTILDSTTGDGDSLTAVVSVNNLAPRLQNIETVSINGSLVTTGLDLASVSGTTVLNVNTDIGSGTATVTNAAAINAGSIVAGANIRNLSVTATASGTRSNVTVDAGSATAVTVAGGAAADTFTVTLAASSTGTFNGGTGIDTYTLNVASGTTTLVGNAATEYVNIVANGATATTIALGTNDLTADFATATPYGVVVSGTSAVTITGDDDVFDAKSITKTGTGLLTVDVTSATDGKDYTRIAADVLELSTAAGAAVTVLVSTASTVNLDGNITGGGVLTLNLAADANSANAGTVVVTVSETQATNALTTGDEVGVIILEATPDTAADTANGARITLAELDTDTNGTTGVVVRGAADLTITAWDNNAGDVLTAIAMTGRLTITNTEAVSTIFLGAGNDTVSDLFDGDGNIVDGGAGNDTITGGANADSISGGTGNDVLSGAAGIDTINGGEGNDVIDGGAGADRITTGSGSDIVRISAAAEDGDVISDFTVGEDRIVLSGASALAAALDLTSITAPTNGVYAVGAFDFTLTGVNVSNLSNVVQLGRTGAQFDAEGSANLVASNFDDNILFDVAAVATITGGLGADSITFNAGGEAQTVNIVAGDSTTTAYDSYTNFVVAEDILNLPSATIAADVIAADGPDVGVFAQHDVVNGIVNFEATGGAAITLNAGNFATAVQYLGGAIANGDTVGFVFGGNTYVFQGNATSDIFVELSGTGTTVALATTTGVDTVIIA